MNCVQFSCQSALACKLIVLSGALISLFVCNSRALFCFSLVRSFNSLQPLAKATTTTTMALASPDTRGAAWAYAVRPKGMQPIEHQIHFLCTFHSVLSKVAHHYQFPSLVFPATFCGVRFQCNQHSFSKLIHDPTNQVIPFIIITSFIYIVSILFLSVSVFLHSQNNDNLPNRRWGSMRQ